MEHNILKELNEAQREAVSDLSSRCILVLAGPGSGKTRTLTSRIAYLLSKGELSPSEIMVLTFTNKAANEMRERINRCIDPEAKGQMLMGTFHSVCSRLLRTHGSYIGISPNYTILDAGGRKSKLKKLALEFELDSRTDNPEQVVGKYKLHRWNDKQLLEFLQNSRLPHAVPKLQALVERYQQYLQDSNLLDFDDLLNFGVDLVQRFGPNVCGKFKHVLVDEFQDTNTTQFEFIAAVSRCRTVEQGVIKASVVGDPDQCIYSWRSADVANLDRLRKLFADDLRLYFLEQNYRSTASILQCSLAVIRQDSSRIDRNLWTSNPNPSPVYFSVMPDDLSESRFVVQQLKRLIEESLGRLKYSDVAVLVRTHALSTQIEGALRQQAIPYKMVGGLQFFERAEVKDLIAYLRLIANDRDEASFVRVVNVPKRGIGETSVAAIVDSCHQQKLGFCEFIVQLASGQVKPAAGTRLPIKAAKAFAEIISTCRKMLASNCGLLVMVKRLIEVLDYEKHLQKAHPETAEQRGEILSNLCQYISNVESQSKAENASSSTRDALISLLELTALDSGLAQDGTADIENRVSVSTIHAAKGLEWALVFVVGAEEGVIPHFNCKTDLERHEERRLMYVAMTRAKALLWITCAKLRGYRDFDERKPSVFLQPLCKLPTSIVRTLPLVRSLNLWRVLGKMLKLEPLKESEISYYNEKDTEEPIPNESDSNSFKRFDYSSRTSSSKYSDKPTKLESGCFSIKKANYSYGKSAGVYSGDFDSAKMSSGFQKASTLPIKTNAVVASADFEKPILVSNNELTNAIRSCVGSRLSDLEIQRIFGLLANVASNKAAPFSSKTESLAFSNASSKFFNKKRKKGNQL